jgi:hypothetical protein
MPTTATWTRPRDGACGWSGRRGEPWFNAVVETNAPAVALWRSLGFEVLTSVPEASDHPTHGYVGLLIMHRFL